MTNILDIHGKITSLYSKTNLRQVANLVLRNYKASHLLGEAANPLFLMDIFNIQHYLIHWYNHGIKQAGAELCQAQAS